MGLLSIGSGEGPEKVPLQQGPRCCQSDAMGTAGGHQGCSEWVLQKCILFLSQVPGAGGVLEPPWTSGVTWCIFPAQVDKLLQHPGPGGWLEDGPGSLGQKLAAACSMHLAWLTAAPAAPTQSGQASRKLSSHLCSARQPGRAMPAKGLGRAFPKTPLGERMQMKLTDTHTCVGSPHPAVREGGGLQIGLDT